MTLTGELTRDTTPEDGLNFSEMKQQMDELETQIDTHFRTSAKNTSNMTNAYSLMTGEMDRLKEEVRNIHRTTTEEIDTLKDAINHIKLDVKKLLLDVKKLFDMEWKNKNEIKRVHEEMKCQLHQTNVATALMISNLMGPLTEQLKILESKMHNLEANTTSMCTQIQENTTSMCTQIQGDTTAMCTQNRENTTSMCRENREFLDVMQIDMEMSTLNSKRMVDELGMDIAMKMESLEQIEAMMMVEKLHSSNSIKNLDKRVEIIAFALSTMDNHDVFTEAVNALNQVTTAGFQTIITQLRQQLVHRKCELF